MSTVTLRMPPPTADLETGRFLQARSGLFQHGVIIYTEAVV